MDILEMISQDAVYITNSTVNLLSETFSVFDSPGTYIMIMVIGFAMIPFLSKSIYSVYTNPHENLHVDLTRKSIKAAITIGAIVFFGYVNFLRFLTPA